MSKQLKKLNYAPLEVEISVIGSSTPTSGSLTISQIKVLLENVNNTIRYRTSANYSEVLHLAQADYENLTAPKATYTADYYDSSTNVYYKHIIVVSYNTLFNSATWVFVSAPMVSGSSSDLQEKLVSGTNIKTINGNSVLGSGDLDTNSNITTTYSPSGSYSPGNLVIYNHQLYECISSTTGTWDSTKWRSTNVKNLLLAKQDLLDERDLATALITNAIGFNGGNLRAGQIDPSCISALPYLTTAPSSANTSGLKIVVLSAEPATRYSGYLYIITGSN